MSDMCTFMSISNIKNLGFEICANSLANINWIKPKIMMQIQNKFEYYGKSMPHLQTATTFDIFNYTYSFSSEYPYFCTNQTSFQFVTNTIQYRVNI